MKQKIIHDEQQHRFEIYVEGHTAYLTYVIRGKIMDIIHTYVPRPLRNRSLAAMLVEAAASYAAKEGYSCQATCPYARTWLLEHNNG